MRRKLMIFAAALTGLAVPVTMAQSNTNAAAPMPQAPQAQFDARPMDDLSDIRYGDLSVFDTITRIGDEQTADEPYCDVRPTLIKTLDHDFAESSKAKSPLAMERSVELFASDVMGTWTAVYTRADGVACIVSSGIGWEDGADALALLHKETMVAQS